MSTFEDWQHAEDLPSDEAEAFASQAELAVLLQAARHPEGVFVGTNAINDLLQYTLISSPLTPSQSALLAWNLGFGAGIAYAEGVTPADAEAAGYTEEDIAETFAEFGIQVGFEGDE